MGLPCDAGSHDFQWACKADAKQVHYALTHVVMTFVLTTTCVQPAEGFICFVRRPPASLSMRRCKVPGSATLEKKPLISADCCIWELVACASVQFALLCCGSCSENHSWPDSTGQEAQSPKAQISAA